MGHTQQLHAKTEAGNELSLSAHTTDAPLLPVAQLERLHAFRPDLVDFVIDETRAEAAFRREQTQQLNGSVFQERMPGMLVALAIGEIDILEGRCVGLQPQA